MNARLALALLAVGGVKPGAAAPRPPAPQVLQPAARPAQQVQERIAGLAKEWIDKR